MRNVRSSFPRVLVYATVLVSIVAIVLAATFLLPDATAAQTAVPGRAAQTDPATPPAPDRLSPLITTPEPGQSAPETAAAVAETDAEAVPFRPRIYLERGEIGQAAPAGEKPDVDVSSGGPDEKNGLPGPFQPTEIDAVMATQGWLLDFSDSFEGEFPADWILWDLSNDGSQRSWGDVFIAEGYYDGNYSIWPADSGADRVEWQNGYPNNLNSWIEREFDFSNYEDVFTSFGLWLDTEEQYDWMYFCVSVDQVDYSCDYWSGDSGGWTEQSYWLTSYAGYSQVWIAFVFQSDSTVSGEQGYLGPFVDAVNVWGYEADGEPTPTPTPDPNGEQVSNGSFESGALPPWQAFVWDPSAAAEANPAAGRESMAAVPQAAPKGGGETAVPHSPAATDGISIVDTTSVEGQYSARLWRNYDGDDILYQNFDIPSGATDITLNFWFGVTTFETDPGWDWFCGSFTKAGTFDILVDLGCMDAHYTTGYWQEVRYSLSDAEIAALAGQNVDLNFELYNRNGDGTGTAAWVDYVRVYVTGAGAGSSLDPNEPNDGPGAATRLTCDTPVKGVIGDALVSYGDEDWFVINNATAPFNIDIKARTDLDDPSELDSMLTLYDENGAFLAFNDDDGFSYDSFIHYDGASGNYYIQVESYTGYGGPEHTYELTVDCNATQSTSPPPTEDPDPGEREWTVILYLNAEDPNFELTLQGYIRNLESFIASKVDSNNNPFMDVLVLYDGPGSGDSVRYHIQPNGNYTNGVNRWSQGEVNMGDPDTLATFAGWAMDLFPAENYYLAIDDHGHGVYGISWDQTNGNDSLTPPEVYSALKDATSNGQRKIDIFDYEACLMGMAENAYDVSQWVDYVIFFEQISWGLNTYPNYFRPLQSGDNVMTVGQRILDIYYNEATAAGYPHTISLIDTGQMGTVKQAATNLGDALIATGDRNAVNNARDNTQAFAASDDATNPVLADYVDLWDLADKTAGLSGVSSAANQVKTAVENAVVYERKSNGVVAGYTWNHDDAHGLSIYYPAFNGSSAFNDYINQRLFQFTRDESGINGRWDEFLAWAVTETGNGAGDGTVGADDRKGMTSVRFLQPRLGGDSFNYLPFVTK